MSRPAVFAPGVVGEKVIVTVQLPPGKTVGAELAQGLAPPDGFSKNSEGSVPASAMPDTMRSAVPTFEMVTVSTVETAPSVTLPKGMERSPGAPMESATSISGTGGVYRYATPALAPPVLKACGAPTSAALPLMETERPNELPAAPSEARSFWLSVQAPVAGSRANTYAAPV